MVATSWTDEVNHQTRMSVYDGDNVVADIAGSGAGVSGFSRLYVTPFLDQNLSMYDLTGAAGTPAANQAFYYSQDGLGSVRTITDALGAVQNVYDYTAFGVPYAQNTVKTVENRYTYTGREASSVGAPMYYRYRMYDAGVGRFTARDPIEFLEGHGFLQSSHVRDDGYASSTNGINSQNLYEYAEGRSANLRDPFGLCTGVYTCWSVAARWRAIDLTVSSIRGITLTIRGTTIQLPLCEVRFSCFYDCVYAYREDVHTPPKCTADQYRALDSRGPHENVVTKYYFFSCPLGIVPAAQNGRITATAAALCPMNFNRKGRSVCYCDPASGRALPGDIAF